MNFTSNRTYEEAYDAWLSGEETTPEESEQLQTRYYEDATFRSETDELRAAASFINLNIDPILALFGPTVEISPEKHAEIWQIFNRRREAERQQQKSVHSSRARAAQWSEAQWDKFKKNLEVLATLSKRTMENAATPSALAMQAASSQTDSQTAQIEGDSQDTVPMRVIKLEIRGTPVGGTVRLEMTLEGETAKQFASWFVVTWLDAGVEGWIEIGATPVSAQASVNGVLREDRFTLQPELVSRLRFTLRPTAERVESE